MTKQDTDTHAGGKMALAFVAGAATAAAVGGYYLFGPDKKKNRKEVEKWIDTVRDEVLEKMEDAKEFNKETYQRVVGEVLTRYAKSKKLSEVEIKRIKKTLQGSWAEMRRVAKESAKEAKEELEDDD